MRLKFAVITLIVLLGSALTSRADTFTFNFSGTSFSGSGTLGADPSGTGKFLITSATGIADGLSILSVAPLNSFGGNDNQLYYPAGYMGQDYFDLDGATFALSNGQFLNLFTNNGQVNGIVNPPFAAIGINGANSPIVSVQEPITISIAVQTAVPEPSTFVLLCSGGLGIVGAIRRKFGRVIN